MELSKPYFFIVFIVAFLNIIVLIPGVYRFTNVERKDLMIKTLEEIRERNDDSEINELANVKKNILNSNLTEGISDVKKKRLPKCLIIGFAKCGTFALRSFLSLHTDIVAASREVEFFTSNYHKGLNWYRQQMPLSTPQQITIEKTPSYILSKAALMRIHAFNASIKLIILVRDPVVRLQSSYAHYLAKTKTAGANESIDQWLTSQELRNLHVDYYKYIQQVYRLFPKEQILIQCEEQLEETPLKVINNVERFLGLRPAFPTDLLVYNTEKGFYCFNKSNSRYQTMKHALKTNPETGCFGEQKGREHPDIKPQLLNTILTTVTVFNEKLFSLIGESFNWTYST